MYKNYLKLGECKYDPKSMASGLTLNENLRKSIGTQILTKY